jgi:hypothetical protein
VRRIEVWMRPEEINNLIHFLVRRERWGESRWHLGVEARNRNPGIEKTDPGIIATDSR